MPAERYRGAPMTLVNPHVRDDRCRRPAELGERPPPGSLTGTQWRQGVVARP
jgi:hypothetical protein